MTQGQYTTREKKFQHLTREKRAQIEILLRQGMAKVQIARAVGISRSTLYNELNRGTVEQTDTNLKKYQRYFGDVGQRVYEENRKNSRPPMKLVEAYDFVRYAEKQIFENKLSPDAVCGEAKLNGRFKKTVSTKTLYSYIDKRMLKVRNIDLPLKVKRKSRTDKYSQNKRLLGMSIEERSDEVNSRTSFGHWEIDTIVGKKESSPVLLALDERLTRKRHLVKIPSRSSEAVRLGLEKIAELYGESYETVFRSVTSDNGSEFVDLGSYLPKSTKCIMLIRIHPMKEVQMKSTTLLFAASSRKECLLIAFPMNWSLLSNIGSTICLVKSSITVALILSFVISYLILQFRLLYYLF